MRIVLAYFAIGSIVCIGVGYLRRALGESFDAADAIVTIVLWPLSLYNRMMAKKSRLDPGAMGGYENLVLDAALREGTDLRTQRERLGHLAPPHPYSPDRVKDLNCSVCRQPPH